MRVSIPEYVISGCIVMLAAAAVAAQQPAGGAYPAVGQTLSTAPPATQGTAGSTVLTLPPMQQGCPVGMQAKQGSSTQMAYAADGTVVPVMTPTLTLTSTGGRHIVRATVTARGTAAQGAAADLVAHLAPNAGRPPSQIVRTVRVALHAAGGTDAAGAVRLSGFSSVEWLELDAFTYADGTEMKLGEGSGCRVAPDPLLLVVGR